MGKTAAQLKATKGLKKSDSLRDAMSTKELVFVMAAEQLAKERIEDENAQGVSLCSWRPTRAPDLFVRPSRRIEQTALRRNTRCLGSAPALILAPEPLRVALRGLGLGRSLMRLRRHADHCRHYLIRDVWPIF
jgi:hypothetical protein